MEISEYSISIVTKTFSMILANSSYILNNGIHKHIKSPLNPRECISLGIYTLAVILIPKGT